MFNTLFSLFFLYCSHFFSKKRIQQKQQPTISKMMMMMYRSAHFFIAASVCVSSILFQGTNCHAVENSESPLPVSRFLRSGRSGRQHQQRQQPNQQRKQLSRKLAEDMTTPATFEYNFTGPIATDGPSTFLFESNTGEDATLLSQQAYSGTIDFELEYTEREFCGNTNGWQAAAVLFFAPEHSTLEDVTTRDNNFATFEANTVASIKDKLYPAIDASYFDKRVIDYATGENVGLRQSLVQPGQMTAGSKFRIVRNAETGMVTYYHYQGIDWVVLTAVELPPAWKNAPLKVGIRLYREYQTIYYLKVKPTLRVDGEQLHLASGILPSVTSDQLRSDTTCAPPVPKCVATAWGDPHVRTFDGLKFDSHVKGEVIMMKSLEGPLQIQARFEGLGSKYSGNPAVTTGLAIRDGTTTTTFPIVQVSMATLSDATATVEGCPVELYIDGEMEDINDVLDPTGSVEVSVQDDGLIVVQYPQTDLRVELTVEKYGMCHFSVDYVLKTCRSDDDSIQGLLGTPDNDASNDWQDRDGHVYALPKLGSMDFVLEPAFEYSKFWKVQNGDESLFEYESGMSFDDFANFNEQYDPALEDLIKNASSDIMDLCGEDDIGCIIEGASLGADAVEKYLSNPLAQSTMGPTPAPVEGRSQIPLPSSTSGGSEHDCPEDITVWKTLPNNIDLPSSPSPIKIISQDTTSVTVEISQVWTVQSGTLQDLFISYETGAFHDPKCENYSDVNYNEQTTEIQIQCQAAGTKAILRFYVQDSVVLDGFSESDGTATVPKCCHPTNPTQTAAEYMVLLSCETKCTSNEA
mmetsp:Transcript_59966/g.147389  ORF Transcript_59966/g.147389 Transcript_59966/m.147389 type:complete len:804 (+) Transcript_59966:59-2470(+)